MSGQLGTTGASADLSANPHPSEEPLGLRARESAKLVGDRPHERRAQLWATLALQQGHAAFVAMKTGQIQRRMVDRACAGRS